MFKQRHFLLPRKSRVPKQSDNLLLVFFRLKRPSNLILIQTIHMMLLRFDKPYIPH